MKRILLILIFAVLSVNTSFSQQWTVVESPNPSPTRNILNGVGSISSSDVWAVGVSGQSPSSTLTQHWNGTAWVVVSSPNPGQDNELYSVKGLSSDNVYAAGYYANFSTPQMLVLHWDGSSWSQQSTPTVMGGSRLENLLIFGPNDIYAAGNKAVGAPGPTTGTLVIHWNGSSWNIETTPNQSNDRHNSITDMKGLSSSDIWAVGYSRNIGENFQAMVLHKTGSTWSIVTVPQPGLENFLYSIDVIAADNIWATGVYNDGSNYIPLFIHYNGSSWTVVSSPGGGAGLINNSAGDIWSTGSEFVHYDGSLWSIVNAAIPPDGNMGSTARISSSDIWAVGRYIDGTAMKTLAMHFGNNPTGINPEPGMLPDEFALFQNYPNPFNPVTKIKYQVPVNGHVTLKIYDALGTELEALVNRQQNPGTYTADWNAAGYPSGVYFYRMAIHSDKLASGSFIATMKMVLIK